MVGLTLWSLSVSGGLCAEFGLPCFSNEIPRGIMVPAFCVHTYFAPGGVSFTYPPALSTAWPFTVNIAKNFAPAAG